MINCCMHTILNKSLTITKETLQIEVKIFCLQRECMVIMMASHLQLILCRKKLIANSESSIVKCL